MFDQRDPTNATHPLRFSETEDGTHATGGTEYTTGIVVNGTPGSINAYTLIHATDSTPDLYYYCTNHGGMGGAFSSIGLVYYVKVVQNFLGEYVYAFSTTANGTYYNQMQLSFVAGEQYLFNVGHASNTGYRLEFGTIVDDITTINTANVIRDDDTIVLDLNNYQGDPLYYFEDTSAGMGYALPTVEFSWINAGTAITEPVSNTNQFGKHVSFSDDGTRFVTVNFNSNTVICYAVVYEWDGSGWNQKVSIVQELSLSTYGQGPNVEMNGDGNMFVYGQWMVNLAENPDLTYSNALMMFYWDGSDWVQKGSAMSGDRSGYRFGEQVSLNNAGTVMSGGSWYDRYTKIFRWNTSTQDWDLDAKILTGSQGGGGALSKDGNTIVISFDIYNDNLQVYDYNGSGWVKRGSTIVGDPDVFEAISRFYINISDDGNTVGTTGGYVYYWDGTDWAQKGDRISGNTNVYLNKDGTKVATLNKIYVWENGSWVQEGSDFSYNLNAINGEGDFVSLRNTDNNTIEVYNYASSGSDPYIVAVSGSPAVFDISGSLQPQIDFTADTTYMFDQSDSTNAGNQIVFGTTPDASTNYITGKTIMGTPGQVGAYTQLELPEDFSGPLFYYHDTIPYMGYGPLVLSVDQTSRKYGEVVTFTVTNRTGVVETYTITGVVSSDINGADLSGTIGYGQQVDLSYVITGGGSDMVF